MADTKNFIDHIQEIKPDFVHLCCEHLESGETTHLERYFQIGAKTMLYLCPYCSGLIVETVLKEYVKQSKS